MCPMANYDLVWVKVNSVASVAYCCLVVITLHCARETHSLTVLVGSLDPWAGIEPEMNECYGIVLDQLQND